ncbi:hypothetical protein EMCRGX_G025046 [Ephydatia muelleri]
MFHTSSQKTYWLFPSQEELKRRRVETNRAYCEKHAQAAAQKGCEFLTPDEEELLCQHYMKKLLEFCALFQPPVPHSAMGTAAAYYKRFFLNSSVMEYHPRDIFLSAVYLAFKVEEYNVSVDQFVHVLAPQFRARTAEMVLRDELLLLQKLKFHLTIHSPFRPLDGLLTDIKTRAPGISNPDQFREGSTAFLLKSLSSDAVFLYPPSQIALAALVHSSRQTHTRVDGYIHSVVLKVEAPSTGQKLLDALQRIEDMVLQADLPPSSKASLP